MFVHILPAYMMNLLSLTSEQLEQAANIKDEISRLERQLSSILGARTDSAPVATRTMSKAAKAKIAAAQRARWAKAKGESSAKPAAKKKGAISAAGRAKISAAAKARWAKAKAAGKKSL